MEPFAKVFFIFIRETVPGPGTVVRMSKNYVVAGLEYYRFLCNVMLLYFWIDEREKGVRKKIIMKCSCRSLKADGMTEYLSSSFFSSDKIERDDSSSRI